MKRVTCDFVCGYFIFLSDGTNTCTLVCVYIHEDLMLFWLYPALIFSSDPQCMFLQVYHFCKVSRFTSTSKSLRRTNFHQVLQSREMPGFLKEHMLGLAVQRRRAGSDDGGTWQAGLEQRAPAPPSVTYILPYCYSPLLEGTKKPTAPMTKKGPCRPDGRGRSFAWDPLVCVLCDGTGVVVVVVAT